MKKDEQAFHEIMSYTVSQLAEGKKPVEIRNDLIQKNIPEEVANQLIESARAYKKEAVRRSGIKMFFSGLGIFIFGVIITGISHALLPTGGYWVTVGLLAVGGVYALAGLIRMLTGWHIK